MQRFVDIVGAVAGLFLLFPFMVLIGLVVKLHDGGPMLYRAKRVGKEFQTFELLKFRTMVPDADKSGEGITTHGDSRITSVGRFLRRLKLDELPQLWNVLKGEMSFVGARPEDPAYVKLYNDQQKKVLAFRPGITSPASLHFRSEESLLHGNNWREHYINNILPAKLTLDLSYLSKRTLWGDMKIILKTLGGILK